MKDNCSLIIPSAKLVGIDIQNEFGKVPPCLIPFSGMTVLDRVIQTYDKKIVTYIGINESKDMVKDYFDFFEEVNINLVELNKTKSIADTIEKIISSDKKILEKPMILNFADTIIQDIDHSLIGKDFISYAKTDETQRWTLFKSKKNKLLEISDKKFQPDPENWKTFIGVWGFKDTENFFRLLSNLNKKDKDCFYSVIKKYTELSKNIVFYESKNFIDCGHIDNYYSARRKMINSRFFNELKISDEEGLIKKTSRNTDKLRNEINWLTSIPKELQVYIPNITNYSTDSKNPFVEMEFYSYPPLNESFIYSRFDFDTWNKILKQLFLIIQKFSNFSLKEKDFEKDLENIYIEKTKERLNSLIHKDFIFSEIKDIKVNNVDVFNLEFIIEELPEIAKRFGIFDIKEFQIIHGDLCFSNILYEPRHCLIKLLDPRGKFGKYDLYGDVYYDLAKLSHSVLGYYDFIMANQFKIKRKDTGYYLHFRTSDYHEIIGNIFKKYVNLYNYDLERIRFIESLLFLSMIPYHDDCPEKQKAMLLHGLELSSKLIKGRQIYEDYYYNGR